MTARYCLALVAALYLAPAGSADPPEPTKPGDLLPGFRRSPWFGEQVRDRWVEGTVRVVVNGPERFDAKCPTRGSSFSPRHGNTIEQTLGRAKAAGLDWYFDIQHVAAQMRWTRETVPAENLILACVEAEGLGWPAWSKATPDAPARIRRVVEGLRELTPGDEGPLGFPTSEGD
jgi:hypothetical protein